MKRRISFANRYAHSKIRTSLLGLTLMFLPLLLSSCEVKKTVDDVINEIDNSKTAIIGESTAWRDQIPKLVNDLSGMESQVNTDTKGILVDTINQIQDLSTQTIQFTDAKANDLIAKTGAEFRCNATFVKDGALAQIQYIIDDLKFWKNNKTHLSQKPNHAVCAVNPSVLSLYPTGSYWLIDSSNMSERNIVSVFGYNFRADALPRLELQNASGQTIRNVVLTAAYITRYQINLDFSSENFASANTGARVVLRWPDIDEANTINLVLHQPAKLKITNPVFTPSSPTAMNHSVILKVTITNIGGLRSGIFNVIWQPDPNQLYKSPISQGALEPGASNDVSFPGYVYQRGGAIISTVSLSNGDDSQHYTLNVAAAPPTPLPEKSLQRFPITASDSGKFIGGTGDNIDYGGPCDPGYQHSSIQVLVTQGGGGGTAFSNGWKDANDVNNCAISVHYSIPYSSPNPNANQVKVSIDIKEKGK